MTFSLPYCTLYPSIYRIELEKTSFEEIISTFNEEILQSCSYSNAELALVDYITSVVEPVGWKGIWRSSRQSSPVDTEHDYVVEVINVSLEKLEADVMVKSIICQNGSSPRNFYPTKIDLNHAIQVPLTELYVMTEDDEEEVYAKTAIAIEHVRIFSSHIVRPWDEEDDTQYTEEILKSRLQLYIDMQRKALPRNLILKVKAILREAQRIQARLQGLLTDMRASDSEAEIGEEDLLSSVALRKRLFKLRAKMEMLENPTIRSFVTKKYIPNKIYKKRPKTSPVTYIVSKQFTSDMILNLPLGPASILEFEHSPEAAFKCCSSGDNIFIFPGTYQCDTLGWVEGNIVIQGVGHREEIILESTGYSEVLLNCCGGRVELLDLTLRATQGLLAPLVVHHGQVRLTRCHLVATDAEAGLLLLGGAEGVLQNTTIDSSKEDGVQLRPLCSLTLKSSCIRSCGRHAVQVDGESSCSPESFTELHLQDSHLIDNAGHGVFVTNIPIADISLKRPEDTDFSVLNLFPWLKCTLENNMIENNAAGAIGVSSSYKDNSFSPSTKNSSFSPSNKNNSFSPSTRSEHSELNYSALSDLLNEVNLSQDSIAV